MVYKLCNLTLSGNVNKNLLGIWVWALLDEMVCNRMVTHPKPMERELNWNKTSGLFGKYSSCIYTKTLVNNLHINGVKLSFGAMIATCLYTYDKYIRNVDTKCESAKFVPFNIKWIFKFCLIYALCIYVNPEKHCISSQQTDLKSNFKFKRLQSQHTFVSLLIPLLCNHRITVSSLTFEAELWGSNPIVAF